MGLMDDARKLAAKGRALAAEHEGAVDSALDRASAAVDERTGGRHADRIAQGRDAVDRFLDSPDRDDEPGGTDRTDRAGRT